MSGARPVRVLLVTPDYHCGVVEAAGKWPHLGFVYVAGALRQAGCEVRIYDAMAKGTGLAEIGQAIADFSPDAVASSAYTSTIYAAIEVLRTAKRWAEHSSRNVLTLLGGVHTTFMWEETLRDFNDAVDIVVRHEGEITTPELTGVLTEAAVLPASSSSPTVSDTDVVAALEPVAGIAFRAEGAARVTADRPYVADLDTLRPAWDLLDWDDYFFYARPGVRLAIVSSSRGCSESCAFCSQQKFWKQSWRARSPEEFVDELEMLHLTYGVSIFFVADEYPTRDRERWREILERLVAKEMDPWLLIETRVEDVIRDADLLPLYRQAGVVHMYVGVEATNQETLDFFKKNAKAEQGREALRLLDEAGIVTETSFILGLPNETPETIEHTLRLALEYDPDFAHFLLLAPWPYSEIWDETNAYVATMDYSKYNLVEPVIKPAAMSREELFDAVLACYKTFYMNKLPIWDRLADGARRRYVFDSLQAVVSHSFLKDYHTGLGEMPAEIKKYLAG